MTWEIAAGIGAKAVTRNAREAESSSSEEAAFGRFYSRTSRALWAYLYNMTGDSFLADDLLQEAYCRLLGTRTRPREFDHGRNYLFRIATNLLRDHYRRAKRLETVEDAAGRLADTTVRVEPGTDLRRAMSALKLRERTMLWLAYVEGATHREIAVALGLREASIRPLLFRARRKLARMLRKKGIAGGAEP